MCLQLEFTLDSRLLTAQWFGDGGRCYVEYFDFDGGAWKPLKRIDVGAEEACYRDIAENLR